MKLFVLLLLLLNLLTFSWIQWGQPTPELAPAELNADKISIVGAPPANATKATLSANSESAVSATTSPPSLPDTTATPTTIPSSTPIPAVPALSATTPASHSVCMEWGPIAFNRIPDAQIRLNKLKLGDRLSVVDAAITGGPYWVYFPPFASKDEADNKAIEWQSKGIKDVTVVRDDKWLNAISLGLYSKEAIAQVRVENLKKIGINAHIEPRGKAAKLFILYNLNMDEIEQLKKMQATFGGPPLRKTTCKPA